MKNFDENKSLQRGKNGKNGATYPKIEHANIWNFTQILIE